MRCFRKIGRKDKISFRGKFGIAENGNTFVRMSKEIRG